MPQPIPKYVQVFKRGEPKIEDMKIILVESFKKGGCEMEPDFKIRNPNAKRTVPYVSADMILISKTKAKIGSNRDSLGDWIYCGSDWYVRCIGEEYQFARYMAYNVDKKAVESPWNQAKYDKENIKALKAKAALQK